LIGVWFVKPIHFITEIKIRIKVKAKVKVKIKVKVKVGGMLI